MRVRSMTLYSQAACHECLWESEREENESGLTRKQIREHQKAHPTHTVYMEQGRLTVYQGVEHG